MRTTRMFGVAKAETPVAVVGVVANWFASDEPAETSVRWSGATVSGVGSFAISDVPEAMRRSALPSISADDLRVITGADLRSLIALADPRATRSVSYTHLTLP